MNQILQRAGLCAGLVTAAAFGADEGAIRFQKSPDAPAISYLSWDTEGGKRVETNLLRARAHLRVRVKGQWLEAEKLDSQKIDSTGGSPKQSRWSIKASPDVSLSWTLGPGADIELRKTAGEAGAIEAAEVIFPFDPKVTPTTILASKWADDGHFQLPAIVSAPDFGCVTLTETQHRPLKGRLEGSRAEKYVNVTLEVPGDALDAPGGLTLRMSDIHLPAPDGLKDLDLWKQARRGWLNAVQPCSKWGEQGKAFSSPAGMLGNNVVSDPASCSVWMYADQLFWTPVVGEGDARVELAPMVARTVDWWITEKTRPTGEVICYWDYGNFIDANAGPLIAAWDYVESTGDTAWLKTRIDRLEKVAEFLARRDIDGDGLVEATQTGNRNALQQPNRSDAWWDALNCGYKDAYTNALTYRAWRCLADLESKLGRADAQHRYTELASKLKGTYAKTLMNPATGMLAWWKSQDGELHDYASPTTNGIAIEYGLIDPAQGKEIIDRLWKKMEAVKFARLDLGVPPMLIPVPRYDYLQPAAPGLSAGDGTDTVGQYMNGGITAGHVLHFLNAMYVVGDNERADKLLRAMLTRQATGGFENGVRDAGGQGIDWTTWDGKPSGYEGYLADSFRFLQAVLLRESGFRERLYRPLQPK